MTAVFRQIRLFVSYSHLDKEWFAKLQPLLKFNASTVTAHIWHDQVLEAGARWEGEIRAALDMMDVFLCLVSNHFLASTYITDVEVKAAFDRERAGATVIVPLLLCDMDDRDIAHLKPFNPLPAWGQSWLRCERDGGHPMAAHKPIRKGLLDVIEKVAARIGGAGGPAGGRAEAAGRAHATGVDRGRGASNSGPVVTRRAAPLRTRRDKIELPCRRFPPCP